ncbi:MAG: hypothetical protein IIT97_01785, partial [Mycoplasmataceae bacterium]|nr:hypothetical protein [Mycoplasmataceae bacterium]
LRSLEQVSPLHLYVEESDKAFEKLKKDVAYQTVFAFISQTSNSSSINNLNIDSIKKAVEEYQQTQNLIQNKQDTTNKPDAKDILAMMMLQQQNKQEKEKENIKNDQQK